MPTTKERVLVTLTPDVARDVKKLAKRERVPRATKIAQLLRKALTDQREDEEDRWLSKIADERYEEWERSDRKTYTHAEVWAAVKKKKR